jgi:hypothetical protein
MFVSWNQFATWLRQLGSLRVGGVEQNPRGCGDELLT